MSAKSQAISFRLSDDKHRRLIGLSAASGLSPGEYARELVMEKLDGEDATRRELDEVRSELSALKMNLASFRTEFALAVEALLVSNSAGKPVSVENARRWVDERIRARQTTAKVT